ncbi:LOW QUALITY PROTEIN: coagulation factor VII [Menidia menidia]
MRKPEPLAVCTLLTCCCLLQSSGESNPVFLDQPTATRLLHSTRRRRANSVFLEEMLPGDLERECFEEMCSQEEAAEIFHTREKTMEFWYKYQNLNPCHTNPCLNGGVCSLDRGGFVCLCPPQYHGATCQSGVQECRYLNGGCLQYCRDLDQVWTRSGPGPGPGLGGGVECGCADGFRLDPDGRTCTPTVPFPCGRQQIQASFRTRSLLDPLEDADVTMETETGLPSNTTLMETDTGLPGNNSLHLQLNATGGWGDPPHLGELHRGELHRGGPPGLGGPPVWGDPGTNSSGGQEAANWTEVTLRIVGGHLERRGGSPWQVLIHRSDGFGFCGGTLVADRWVLSAAHCFEEEADHVTVGNLDKLRPDPGEQRIKIQEVIVHPHFHSFTFDSDIALLFLARPVLRGPTAIPACLPDPHLSQYLLREENRGVVSGWGATQYLHRSSRFLRKVTLPVVSHQACTATTEQVITDNMFCAGYLQAGGRDACSGDSGGPFLVHYRGTWFLTGVVSWGEKCAAQGKYGVYTRLGNFLGWVRDTMGQDQDQDQDQGQDQDQDQDQGQRKDQDLVGPTPVPLGPGGSQ